MTQAFSPTTELELAETIAAGGPFAVKGLGMREGFGRAMPPLATLNLKAFAGIESYEPEELVLEAGAATPLADVQSLVASRRQMLAFEPPDLSHLWGARHAGSIGGLLATGLAGPRRIKAGSVRDHVLGVRGVSGRGEIFKAGARVVKNVTGYDMPKLMAGSFGTLVALTSVTFKVLPAPEMEETLVLPGLDDATAISVMSTALQSSAEVSAAAHVPGEGTFLRLEGIAISVAARRDGLVKLLQRKCHVIEGEESALLWSRVRDVRAMAVAPQDAVWRISVAPTEGATVAAHLRASGEARYYHDWGGGLLWVALPCAGKDAADAGAARVRAAVRQGHATLLRASEELRQRVAVFQPQDAAVAALTRRVKAAFDPAAKLNPSRMYEGV